jgi:glycosyltransferase involved in cell wall biosynthesis
MDLGAGGPTQSLKNNINSIAGLSDSNFQKLYTLTSKNALSPNELHQNVSFQTLPSLFKLAKNVYKDSFDLAHINGIWQFSNHIVSNISRIKRKPYVISPRGMLEPWSLTQSNVIKKIALILYQNKDLKCAGLLHATSNMEAENLRKIGFHNNIAVIPNAVDLSTINSDTIKKDNLFLFISRIHPKKGLDILIKAIASIDKKDLSNWKFEIYGNGDSSYINNLKDQVKYYNLNGFIEFLPAIYGEKKINKIKEASALILPSFSENFGNIIAESLACSTPVITTYYTPWEDLKEYDCGWQIKLDVLDLKNTILEAMRLESIDISRMGKNGRNLIEKKYSTQKVSTMFLELYKQVLDGNFKEDVIF